MSVCMFDPPVLLGPGLVYDRRIPEITGRAQQAALILSEMLQARFPELLRPGHADLLEVRFDIEGGLTFTDYSRKITFDSTDNPRLVFAWYCVRAEGPGDLKDVRLREFGRCVPLAGTGPWRLDALQRFFNHILVPSVSDWENCQLHENEMVPVETRFTIPGGEEKI